MGRIFESGSGTHSAFRTSQVPESAANQLKGCRSNQMHGETKPASAVRLFTSQFNSTKCAAADILRALCTAPAAFGDDGRTQVTLPDMVSISLSSPPRPLRIG